MIAQTLALMACTHTASLSETLILIMDGASHIHLPVYRRPRLMSIFHYLWRGYVSIYRLNSAGQLILEKYAYPNLGRKREPDMVNEVLVGDFFLVMKMKFEGVRTYIPFKSGRIVTDREEWIIEED